MSDAPSAIHSIVLPFHLTVFASWFCGDRQERAYPLPRALFATASQLLQSAAPIARARRACGHSRNRFWALAACPSPDIRVPAAVRQAGRRLAGRRAVIRTAFCTWLIRAAAWLQVPSGGAWVVSDTCVLALALAFPELLPRDSFRAGFVSLCHLPAAPEPPWAAGLAPCHAGRRCPTDNQGQWKCRLRLP